MRDRIDEFIEEITVERRGLVALCGRADGRHTVSRSMSHRSSSPKASISTSGGTALVVAEVGELKG